MNRHQGIAVAILVGLTAAVAPPVGAAIIHVDDGEVIVQSNQRCSLYEAIINAEADAAVHADCAAGNGADVLRLAFDGDYHVTEEHTPGSGTALPLITSAIVIDGQGGTIRRGTDGVIAPMRAMVAAAADLTLRNLHFRDWHLETSQFFEGGSVIWLQGGRLVAQNVHFQGNGVTLNGRGGAVQVSPGHVEEPLPQATFTDCLFDSNFVDSLPGQSGTGGGAIMVEAGKLDIDRCAFIDNRTAESGQAQGGLGGAIYLGDHGGFSTSDPLMTEANIANTTFSGNQAGMGGAISLQSVQGFSLLMRLGSVTMAANRAFGPVKGISANAGTGSTGQITIAYATSILHGNGDAASDHDCTSTGGMARVYWESGGGNLLRPGDGGCPPDPFGEDILAVSAWDHIAQERVDHGHDLLPGSPLIDLVAFGQCDHGVSTDQRDRIRGGGPGQGGEHCDVGAVEYYGKIDDIIFRDGFEIDG